MSEMRKIVFVVTAMVVVVSAVVAYRYMSGHGNVRIKPGYEPVQVSVDDGLVRYVPYQQACREGWAPQPTNDAQRTFYRQMRERIERGPTKPITIPPPKK